MAQWHCHIGGKAYGPVEAQQIRQWVQEQRMQPTDNVWCEGMPAWQPANSVAGLLTPTAADGTAPPPLPGAPAAYDDFAATPGAYLKPHRGTTILVLGILGLTVCGVLGIVAWVMGSGDLREMDAGRMDPAGRGNTNAGKICGIISTVLILISMVFIFFVMGSAMSHARYR
ncbi:MAG: GYF domain-containing protein [Planctomycetota bacterium]|nr:GYF domain-containing protein [Planctomycetota bacterium]